MPCTVVGRPQHGHRLFAALYDRVTAASERKFVVRHRAQLLGLLDGKVLEIGVGTGANFPYYPPAAEVVGIEPDPFMLRRAEVRLARSGRPNITLQSGSAERLLFADQSFDHVVSTLVLCTVADPLQALAEIRRVLKSGGALHIIEHVRAEGWLGHAQDLLRPAWQFVGAGCVLNRRTAELIQAAGFRIETLVPDRIGFGIPMLVGTARPT